MTGAEAVDTIQAILQQFNLVEKEAGNVEKATYKVSDAIVSISKSLKMDFSDGIAEIADGIKVSGSVMEQAGVSLESYSGMLASVIETTRLAGSQRLPIYRNIDIKNFVKFQACENFHVRYITL